jgi:two-component system response regulator DevR
VKVRNGDGGSRCHDAGVELPIRLAIVDDHPAIGAAIEAAAASEHPPEGERPIRVVATARTLAKALELVRPGGSDAPEDVPEIVLCDIQLQAGTDGLDVVSAATAAGLRAIVLTSFDRSSLMRAAFERGAAGYLDKGAELRVILRAVRTVADGGTAFSAAILDAARNAPRPPSDRELAVLREVHSGATSDEIGLHLGISGRTVESHLRRLFDRYGVVSRTELAMLAVREGWIDA